MRKRAFFVVSIAAFVTVFIIGCKDKKPEPVEVEETDSVEVADTVPEAVIDTVPEDAMDSLISAAPVPKAADGLFDDFLFIFTANKKLQYERIQFPLKVYDGDSESEIKKEEWHMERFYSKDEFYTLILDDEKQLDLAKDTNVDSVVIEKIDLKAKSVEQHVFNRVEGQWMLTSIHRNTMFQNPNKSFLAFYEKFASDSVFQQESVADPVATIIPDPDDDFSMIEGEFHPEQWDEFKPPVLPSDFIYNVIYGQKYKKKNEKLFVIRGIANGLEVDMTFKQRDGKWQLVKLVE